VVDSRFKKTLVAVGGAALLTASALPAVAQEEGPLLYVINKSADQQ
jgi:ABC-type sugar transport system substrate-binding protein